QRAARVRRHPWRARGQRREVLLRRRGVAASQRVPYPRQARLVTQRARGIGLLPLGPLARRLGVAPVRLEAPDRGERQVVGEAPVLGVECVAIAPLGGSVVA